MAVRPIVRYPDRLLKQPTGLVGEIDETLRSLVTDLVETMRSAPATVGLAAPQIGQLVRCFVMDASRHPKVSSSHGLVTLFDPEVIDAGAPEVAREGCLSVPDLTANVRRAGWVDLRGLDPDGSQRSYRLEGFEARVALHELDHLDGLLILDRAVSASDLFARKVYGSGPAAGGTVSS